MDAPGERLSKDGPQPNQSMASAKGLFLELAKEWATFLRLLGSPLTFLLLVTSLVLVWLSARPPQAIKDVPAVMGMIAAILSLFAGVAGARIERQWSSMMEAGVLATRAKSAVRGLKLLLLNISALDKRTKIHLGRELPAGYEPSTTGQAFEEIIGRCESLQEEAVNAMEEWEDIIPGLDVRTQIGLISDLREQVQDAQLQREELRSQLAKAEARGSAETEGLRSQLKEKTVQVRQLEKELSEKERSSGFSLLTSGHYQMGSQLFPFTGRLPLEPPQAIRCQSCGAENPKSIGTTRCGKCGTDIPPAALFEDMTKKGK